MKSHICFASAQEASSIKISAMPMGIGLVPSGSYISAGPTISP